MKNRITHDKIHVHCTIVSVAPFEVAVYLSIVSLMEMLIDRCTINKANPFNLSSFILDLRKVFSLRRSLMERSASQLVRGHTVIMRKIVQILGSCCFLQALRTDRRLLCSYHISTLNITSVHVPSKAPALVKGQRIRRSL